MKLQYDPERGTIRDMDDPFIANRVAFISRAQAEAYPGLPEQMAAAPELLAALKGCHEALDQLFAMLIVRTSKMSLIDPDAMFYPTKSGQPWEAMLEANRLIKMLT